MTGMYHMNCRANRVWWLRWPVPRRVLVAMQYGPWWMQQLLIRRGLSRVVRWEVDDHDEMLKTRTFRCERCWLFIHEDL